jgi:hypothetical protein
MSSYNMTAAEVVSKLRAEVEARTGLTISAGIAPNTMLAKICSDKNKPNGQYELAFEGKAIREFMSDLPIRRIPGIGRVAERYAASMGVKVRWLSIVQGVSTDYFSTGMRRYLPTSRCHTSHGPVHRFQLHDVGQGDNNYLAMRLNFRQQESILGSRQ